MEREQAGGSWKFKGRIETHAKFGRLGQQEEKESRPESPARAKAWKQDKWFNLLREHIRVEEEMAHQSPQSLELGGRWQTEGFGFMHREISSMPGEISWLQEARVQERGRSCIGQKSKLFRGRREEGAELTQ